MATCNACLVVHYTWLKNTIKEVNKKEGQRQWPSKDDLENVEECMCYECHFYDNNWKKSLNRNYACALSYAGIHTDSI